ncbi:Alkali-sensitive linkage protein 1 [Vanrija pseudolonga]|uniref:Alkali-sensitive linkage protein 1 n=1 Tax=Vanrija pseudolonga TaxID=143232 RepID=A0AAF0YEH8_9TREE|nr:Alkali-sensitive linkage protein 1 [Vanrija pseudolonga]
MFVKLATVLPYLALAGLAIEAVPVTASSNSVNRHPRDRHFKHIGRHAAPAPVTPVGAQKKRSKLHRRADGSVCRPRPKTTTQQVAAAAPAPTPASSDNGNAGSDAAAASPSPAADNGNSGAAPAADAAPSPAAASPTPADGNGDAAPSDAAPSPSIVNEQANANPAPASSSSAPAAPSQAPAPPPSNGGAGSTGKNAGSKLGLAWPNGDFWTPDQPDYIGNYVGSKTSWYYTWAPSNVASGDSVGLEFVPMLWGVKQVGDWNAARGSWPSSVKNALFFNEPNQSGQSDISVNDALQYWMNDYLPARTQNGLRLGHAGTTSAPNGLTWVTDFYNVCTGAGNSAADCSADFVPVHYYDVDVGHFQSYLQNFHQVTGKNLWVTEYACQNFNGGAQCSQDQTWAFHQQIAAWMDGQDWIERYAPFGFMRDMQGVNGDNALMNSGGGITDLGSWYINSS